MTHPIITVEHLSKAYRIGLKEQIPDTLASALTGLAKAPLRKYRQLRRLNTFGANGDGAPDTLWALRDVSFEVNDGEVLGIIGRNGAGKSTLLKILSRITEPTSGRAVIHGRVSSLLEVGTGFHPELSGRENVYLNGTVLGMTKREIDRKFDEIVDFSGVEKFLDTPIKRYSSGMTVRLAFAVAAHLEPEILIVDEVLAVGDAEFQKKCMGKMKDVARNGRTVLFVSHNTAAVTQMCDRVLWIAGGAIQANGHPAEIIPAYLAQDSAPRGERCWTNGNAPGDDKVRLLNAQLLQHGLCTPVVDINEPCQIQLEFDVRCAVTNLICGVNLYNDMDLCLFASCDWRPNYLKPGQYRKVVAIPARVFAEGRLSVLVQLGFYDPFIASVVVPEALSFNAIESIHPGKVRGHFTGTWPGVLRLALAWSESTLCSPESTDSRVGKRCD